MLLLLVHPGTDDMQIQFMFHLLTQFVDDEVV